MPATRWCSSPRLADDGLYRALAEHAAPDLSRIGDCEVPGGMVHAVHAGHRYTRELDTNTDPDMPFLREWITA
ncbi:MAG: hypothetical protein GDA49_00760 [Rhodospirillales bacterium]|nr:hypothetical protein [Rhodospirillales bacterium]